MRRLGIVAGLVLLASVPLWVGSTYYVNISSQILFYAIFALGVNVLAGYAGLVSLGHAGLFGIAAYSGAKIMNDSYGHVAVVAGALAATLAASAVFAVLALRGTGLGFVMSFGYWCTDFLVIREIQKRYFQPLEIAPS